mmetsp:Transcript_89272/g.257472  ORF Transcript_89272/g.257472 Transcript_89272/m.257472 type:complete len:298 (-) Transcript_89272:793-1686(-)
MVEQEGQSHQGLDDYVQHRQQLACVNSYQLPLRPIWANMEEDRTCVHEFGPICRPVDLCMGHLLLRAGDLRVCARVVRVGRRVLQEPWKHQGEIEVLGRVLPGVERCGLGLRHCVLRRLGPLGPPGRAFAGHPAVVVGKTAGGLQLRRVQRPLRQIVHTGGRRRQVRRPSEDIRCDTAFDDHAADVQGVFGAAQARSRHRDIEKGLDELVALPHCVRRDFRVLRCNGRGLLRPAGAGLRHARPINRDIVSDDVGRLRLRGDGGGRPGFRLLLLLQFYVPYRAYHVVYVDRHHHGRLC